MKSFILIISLLVFLLNNSIAQETEPEWLRVFNEEQAKEFPDALKVAKLYYDYELSKSFVKSDESRKCKYWLLEPSNWGIDMNAYNKEQDSLRELYLQKFLAKPSPPTPAEPESEGSSLWKPVGPLQTYLTGNHIQYHSHVRSISVCKSNQDIIYCSTEPGEIYKSIDRGENWVNVSLGYELALSGHNGASAIAVNPGNPDEVIVSGDKKVYKTIDGGQTWTQQTVSLGTCFEIMYHQSNYDTIYFGCDNGLYISTDGGKSLNPSSLSGVYKFILHPTNENIVYATAKNETKPIADFYRSTDAGFTWEQLGEGNGWYDTNDANASLKTAIIAVTKAEPDNVYVLLLGQSKAGDKNFIGLFKSSDQGVSWSLTHNHIGSPYTSTDINPASTATDRMCELIVSDKNPNHIIIGNVQTYISDNGGITFKRIFGGIHADVRGSFQDDSGIWIANDGGIVYTTDALNSHIEFKEETIHSQDFWGFGVGWHKKTMIGGLYHNGVTARSESFPDRIFHRVGDGEPATGEVNPHDANMVYWSNRIMKMSDEVNTNAQHYSVMAKSHFRSHQPANGSRYVFHPNNYNTFFFGEDGNQLWKTEDNGQTVSLVYKFEDEPDHKVCEIEISSSNTNVMYVTLSKYKSVPALYKTIDGGVTWNKISIPVASNIETRLAISINPEDENHVYLGVQSGNTTMGYFNTEVDGEKVYQSLNGGTSWQNLSTATLDGEVCNDIICYTGSNGGVYFFSQNAVYYRDNSMSDWEIQNNGLEFFVSTNHGNIYYKEGNLMIGTFGRGVWETDIHTPMSRPVARIMVDKFSTTASGTGCDKVVDSFEFDDYSFLRYENDATGTWKWEFPTGSPSVSTERSPIVKFLDEGKHIAKLTVTDYYGNTSTATLEVEVIGGGSVSLPNAVISTEKATCKGDDGKMTFTFEDNSSYSTIEFSTDGGNTYSTSVADNSGSTTITGLTPKTYDVWARWGDGGCPTQLGSIIIDIDCEVDCNGVPEGSAYIDGCNECVGGTTGKEPCVKDCNGDWGGTAFLDDCNICVEGNTGKTPCVEDCNGELGGTAFIDDCGDCVGGSTGLKACCKYEVTAGGIISGTNLVCQGERITYTVSDVEYANNYTWTVSSGTFTGQGTNTIEVDFTGSVSVGITVIASNDCSAGPISTFSVEVTPLLSPINLGSDIDLCSPAFTTLDAGLVSDVTYKWFKDGITVSDKQTLLVTEAGTYKAELTSTNPGCPSVSDEIKITSSLPEGIGDTICFPGYVDLEVVGNGEYTWYDASVGGNIIDIGTKISESITETQAFYVEVKGSVESYIGADETNHSLTNASQSGNVGIQFTAYDAFDITEMTIHPFIFSCGYGGDDVQITMELKTKSGALVGTYSATPVPCQGVQNSASNVKGYLMKFTTPISIPSAGDYVLKPVSGATLFWYQSGANYSNWGLDGVVSLTEDTETWKTGSYPGIFDIKVVSAGANCDRKPVYGVIDENHKDCIFTSIEENNYGKYVEIYPNPNTGLFTVKLNTQETANLTILDVYGHLVSSEKVSGIKQINLQDKAAGVYYVKIESERINNVYKVVIN